MINLACPTDPQWVQVVINNFDEFLKDHADCERKASAMAMKFVAKCPDQGKIVRPLINLALEELRHFKQVYALMEKRGLSLNTKMTDDPYVNRLFELCRPEPRNRLLDRFIIVSIVETRGAERFKLVYQALTNKQLKSFYRALYLAEVKHGNVFIHIARKIYPKDEIENRLRFFVQKEAEIIQSLEWRPSLH